MRLAEAEKALRNVRDGEKDKFLERYVKAGHALAQVDEVYDF